MIKVETKLIKERGVVAIQFEASSPADTENLDLILGCLSNRDKIDAGYIASNKVLLHVRDMPSALFDPDPEEDTDASGL